MIPIMTSSSVHSTPASFRHRTRAERKHQPSPGTSSNLMFSCSHSIFLTWSKGTFFLLKIMNNIVRAHTVSKIQQILVLGCHPGTKIRLNWCRDAIPALFTQYIIQIHKWSISHLYELKFNSNTYKAAKTAWCWGKAGTCCMSPSPDRPTMSMLYVESPETLFSIVLSMSPLYPSEQEIVTSRSVCSPDESLYKV